MYLLVGLLILALMAVPLAISIRRSTELFCLEVRKGRARIRRGHLPQRLLDDINEVVKKPRVPSATIRVVTENRRPRVLATGQLEEDQIQRLRNVVGTYDLAKIRAAAPPR